MRMNAPQVAQYVEMQRGGLKRLGPALAQAFEVSFGRRQFGIAQRRFLREQFTRLIDVARHEHAECDP